MTACDFGRVGFGEVSATDCRSLPKYFLEVGLCSVMGNVADRWFME
jgi:hypothetical protein